MAGKAWWTTTSTLERRRIPYQWRGYQPTLPICFRGSSSSPKIRGLKLHQASRVTCLMFWRALSKSTWRHHFRVLLAWKRKRSSKRYSYLHLTRLPSPFRMHTRPFSSSLRRRHLSRSNKTFCCKTFTGARRGWCSSSRSKCTTMGWSYRRS